MDLTKQESFFDMKLSIENNIIPLLGWLDLTVTHYYKLLEKDVNQGLSILHTTYLDFEDGEICAFIFYKDFAKELIKSIYIGKVEFISSTTDHLRPFGYNFYPLKRTKVKGIAYGSSCGEPEAVMLKTKKL